MSNAQRDAYKARPAPTRDRGAAKKVQQRLRTVHRPKRSQCKQPHVIHVGTSQTSLAAVSTCNTKSVANLAMRNVRQCAAFYSSQTLTFKTVMYEPAECFGSTLQALRRFYRRRWCTASVNRCIGVSSGRTAEVPSFASSLQHYIEQIFTYWFLFIVLVNNLLASGRSKPFHIILLKSCIKRRKTF